MTAALVLGAVLAVLAVLLVALPFLRDPAPADDVLGAPDALERRRLELAEERDRALAALAGARAGREGGPGARPGLVVRGQGQPPGTRRCRG
jgi:hypothetical protein